MYVATTSMLRNRTFAFCFGARFTTFFYRTNAPTLKPLKDFTRREELQAHLRRDQMRDLNLQSNPVNISLLVRANLIIMVASFIALVTLMALQHYYPWSLSLESFIKPS